MKSAVRRPFIKVCGITRKEDARGLARLGVDALGFIQYSQSPRGLGREEAISVAQEAEGVARVLVTVDQDPTEINRTLREGAFHASQLHGDETPKRCSEVEGPVVKAIRTRPDLSEEDLRPYKAYPILLDGYSTKSLGGTGRLSDWTLARELVQAGYRVILAGGLGPENLEEAIAAVEPLAVDLNSAVEVSPGVKDLASVQHCLEIVQSMAPRKAEDNPWQA